jgi:hypothetical protein
VLTDWRDTLKPETDDILALAGRFERQADSIDKLIESLGNGSGSHSSVVINAGAGVVGACLALAIISLATLCFVGGIFYSMSKSVEQAGIDNGLQDIRIRKLEQQKVTDSGK